jgi:hypothetical protein
MSLPALERGVCVGFLHKGLRMADIIVCVPGGRGLVDCYGPGD